VSSQSSEPVPALGARQFALLLEGWRGAGAGSLARRLAQAARSRIASGLVAAGTLLPPERSLATALGVSRSTVVAALDELRSGGFVESRQGSGTRVAAIEQDVGEAMTSARRLLLGGANLNLAASVPSDASQLPALTLDVADLASINPAHGYAPAGLFVLREAITARHAAQGLATAVEQIHVTNGAQHALDLALSAVTRPGDVVAIEDPTYVGVFDLLDARGLRPLALPLDVVHESSAELVQLCRGGRARALLLVPAVHSPTGRVRRAADLQRLADRLDALALPVIEDNTLADLVFTGRRAPSLAIYCRAAPVLSVESMSKVAWGGLRVGWLRAGKAEIERTVRERSRVDFGTSIPSQLLARQLIDHYDVLIAERRRTLAGRAKLFTRLVREGLPEWRGEAPGGGLSTWIDTGVDADVLAAHALRHGVTVAPGVSASRLPAARTYLRLCFDRPALEVQAALAGLTRAWEDTRGWRPNKRTDQRSSL
jgi:DNA-binding transcriptional MocR family regulator